LQRHQLQLLHLIPLLQPPPANSQRTPGPSQRFACVAFSTRNYKPLRKMEQNPIELKGMSIKNARETMISDIIE